LNAFRHHRNSHSNSIYNGNNHSKCSTPFGIIGILTLRTPPHRRRHFWCSTPFGIIGILTRPSHPTRKKSLCAQSLSSSSEFSRIAQIVSVKNKFVLNAFRHHRNSHQKAIQRHSRAYRSAQRLSASSEFSPSRHLPPRTDSLVLNAFRHHRNSHRTAEEP